jgi:hypothetical protein
MAKKNFRLGILVIVLVFGMTVVGCDDSSDTSIGCSSLKVGEECTAQSSCGSKFLCMTGQGSDSNCTESCSCQQ